MIDRRCRRSGCRFPRGRTTGTTHRLRPYCSPECLHWSRWARSVASWEDGPAAQAEAQELLKVADALDRRRRPNQPVPEFPMEPNPCWAYAVSAV